MLQLQLLLTKTKRCQRITPVLRNLHWVPVAKRSDCKILTITKWMAPSYISYLLQLHRSVWLCFASWGLFFFGSTCNQTQAYSARSFSDSRCPLSPTFLVCRLQKKCPNFLQRGLKESFKSTCVVNQCTLTFSDFTCFRIPYNYRLLRILSYLRYYWSYLVCRSYVMFIVQIFNKLFISSF